MTLAALRSAIMLRGHHLRACSLTPRTPSALRWRPRPATVHVRAISSTVAMADKVNIFSDYTVYKGKGAVAVKVIKPTWVRVSSGSGISLAREGTVLLEFATAIAERTYDWNNKGNFALSALECADVLEALETRQEASFFHDPSKGGSDEGQVKKVLKLSPAPSGFYLNLTVTDRVASKPTQYSTALSPAEARLIRRLMDFCIPHLLGFDEIFSGPPEIKDTAEPPPF